MKKYLFEDLEQANFEFGKTITLYGDKDVYFLGIEKVSDCQYELKYKRFEDQGQECRTVRGVPLHKQYFDSIVLDDEGKLHVLYKLIK